MKEYILYQDRHVRRRVYQDSERTVKFIKEFRIAEDKTWICLEETTIPINDLQQLHNIFC